MLTFGAVILVVFLAIPEQTMPGLLSGTTARAAEVITSPFQNTFAMVRWNTRLPERIPLIKKYEPFFRAVHVSMPELDKERPAKFHDWETDQAPNTFTIYSVSFTFTSTPGLTRWPGATWIGTTSGSSTRAIRSTAV